MKALISAFALLSFVAAATVPVAARADAPPVKTHHVVKKHKVKKVAQAKRHARHHVRHKMAPPPAKG